MKQIIFCIFIPFSAAAIVFYYFLKDDRLNNIFPDPGSTCGSDRILFSDDAILLFGSSELSEETDAKPSVFISSRFKTKVRDIGHAGNQCFSIYMQLLAHTGRLNNAPVVFIISPGWFESRPSLGTSAEVFLEFNPDYFLCNVLSNPDTGIFQSYAYKRVADFYNEYNSPGVSLKLMNARYQASKSFLHRAVYAPFIKMDEWLLEKKKKLMHFPSSQGSSDRDPVIPENIRISWDSLYRIARESSKAHSTNNDLGIDNEYYLAHINDHRGKIDPVSPAFNQELADFKMLVRLLKQYHVKASFVIQPLNALYFSNIEDMQPAMDLVNTEIASNGFRCLNLFTSDRSSYDKAMLRDIMHMSDLGWYKMDKFIIDTYSLAK